MKPAPKPAATTRAPRRPADDVAAAGSISRPGLIFRAPACVVGRASYSADRLEQPAVTAVPSQPSPPPVEAPPAPNVNVAVTPAAAATTRAAMVPLPPPEPAAAPPVERTVASTDAAKTDAAKVDTTEKSDAKQKHVANKKAKRKSKHQRKAPAKHERDDDDIGTVASADEADIAVDDRASRRRDGSRRIVERWTERDYEVPADDGRGRRRVTVIGRSGGGLFENLFGMGRNDD